MEAKIAREVLERRRESRERVSQEVRDTMERTGLLASRLYNWPTYWYTTDDGRGPFRACFTKEQRPDGSCTFILDLGGSLEKVQIYSIYDSGYGFSHDRIGSYFNTDDLDLLMENLFAHLSKFATDEWLQSFIDEGDSDAC